MIGPTHYQWQTKLGSLMERYYKIETRTTIRMKVLDVLANVIYVNRYYKYNFFDLVTQLLQLSFVRIDVYVFNINIIQ